MIKRANQKKKKGFSLIELIIVLAVMAIIALIAIPNFTAVRENSKVKADTQSCETIDRAVLMLVADGTVSSVGTVELVAPIKLNSTTGNYDGITNATGSSFTEKELNALGEALKEINKPQGNKIVDSEGTAASGMTGDHNSLKGYSVEVKANGDVIVKTTSEKKHSNFGLASSVAPLG